MAGFQRFDGQVLLGNLRDDFVELIGGHRLTPWVFKDSHMNALRTIKAKQLPPK
jgi:hypothetical protein